MNTNRTIRLVLATAGLLACALSQAQGLSKADYSATKTRIEADAKADKAQCGSRSGNARDICMEQAKAKEKVALADLEFGYTGKADDRIKAQRVRAETTYAVAKERCDDKAGNVKDVCLKEAKAAEVGALAQAKLGKEVGAARADATASVMDADYKVAAEKCDALAGDARARCMTAAKAKYGK
jgi:hypothetical protein